MSLEDQFVGVLELLLAALLSFIIGSERERRGRNAGLRTHMLVGIGSCLFTILSAKAFGSGDPGRIAAQVVAGIGFLGAGAILKDSGSIHGLTTAASIWATAAIGMAVGIDAWFTAICTTLLIWFVLVVVRRIESHHHL